MDERLERFLPRTSKGGIVHYPGKVDFGKLKRGCTYSTVVLMAMRPGKLASDLIEVLPPKHRNIMIKEPVVGSIIKLEVLVFASVERKVSSEIVFRSAKQKISLPIQAEILNPLVFEHMKKVYHKTDISSGKNLGRAVVRLVSTVPPVDVPRPEAIRIHLQYPKDDDAHLHTNFPAQLPQYPPESPVSAVSPRQPKASDVHIDLNHLEESPEHCDDWPEIVLQGKPTSAIIAEGKGLLFDPSKNLRPAPALMHPQVPQDLMARFRETTEGDDDMLTTPFSPLISQPSRAVSEPRLTDDLPDIIIDGEAPKSQAYFNAATRSWHFPEEVSLDQVDTGASSQEARYRQYQDFDLDPPTLARFVTCESDYKPLGATFGLKDEQISADYHFHLGMICKQLAIIHCR